MRKEILVLGDIHGKWDKTHKIIKQEVGTRGVSLSTGDLCNYDFDPEAGQKIVFCHGNHENYDKIQRLNDEKGQLTPLLAGEIYKLPGGISLTALPGVYSPHFYEGENLKYFTKKDLRKIFSINEPVDILITHEAPRGIGVKKNGEDLGKNQINDVIAHLRPKIAFFGHHHEFIEGEYKGIRIFGTEMPHHSYLMLDTNNFDISRVKADLDSKLGYQYKWEKR